MAFLAPVAVWAAANAATIAAVTTVAASAYGAYSSHAASKDAKKLGKMNAEQTAMETQEGLRRLQITQRQSLGEAKANSAASGISEGGSSSSYIQELGDNYKQELDWLSKSGASQAAIERASGKAESDILRNKSIGQGVKTGTDFYDLGTNEKWW
jgi:hypothetical protein